jgi:hypothetical protein
MNIRHTMVLSVPALLLAVAQCYAGPCSKQIEETQVQIDSRLNAAAAAGPAAAETSAAMMHRQPTPKSIAGAEEKLGDISPETVRLVAEAMTRARQADAADDRAGCERALDDARRAIAN